MGKRGLQPLGPASPIDTTKELLAWQHRAKTVDAGSRMGRGEKRKKEKEVHTHSCVVSSSLCKASIAKKSAIERRCRGPKCWEANKQTHSSTRCEGPGTPANTEIHQQARCWQRQLFQINETTTSLTDLVYIVLLTACRCTPPLSTLHKADTGCSHCQVDPASSFPVHAVMFRQSPKLHPLCC